MGATIKDVARRAGVSIATVSRVFNNGNMVLEVTKTMVRKAADELHYTPHASARSLSRRKTESIGLLLPDLHGEFFSEVIRGADQTARLHQYHLLVSSSHNSKQDIAAAIHAMRGRVDGIIVMSPHLDAQTVNANLPTNLPLVLLNCYLHREPFDAINIDNERAAYRMVQHLLTHGHTRIAIIKGTDQNIDSQERLAGYRGALRDGGAVVDPRYEIAGDFDEESGYRAVASILALSPRPTAIFASNDSMAIGALSALRVQNVDVPREMALSGFDDVPISQFLTPGLTSMRVRISNLGVEAVERLLAVVRGENQGSRKKQTVIVPELVIRESCGCVRTET